jgi:hypothetical protein
LKADPQFLRQPKEFWANVRTISQAVGYTKRLKGAASIILIPTLENVRAKFEALDLTTAHIANEKGELSAFGEVLFAYFRYRAVVLNDVVRPLLMNKDEAKAEFERLHKDMGPKCPIPMNKQKGEKKAPAFLTGIVNILLEANIGGIPCNYDPKGLTTVTHEAMPLRTLSRRVDGALPSIVNPLAIWEIKEYYFTTTFGSRVADGVYETLVDGMELEELEAASERKIYHVLFIDGHLTWWVMGRSYLCRLIDLLHMGFVDEVIVGREALNRVPTLAREWKTWFEQLKTTTTEPIATGDVPENGDELE